MRRIRTPGTHGLGQPAAPRPRGESAGSSPRGTKVACGNSESAEVLCMAIPFPSLEFFEALAKRTVLDAAVFEKLGYCDTSFGVKVDGDLYALHFEVYECTKVE